MLIESIVHSTLKLCLLSLVTRDRDVYGQVVIPPPEPAAVLMLKGVVESKGKYTTKEEVEKAPSEDHPCNLTRTSFKVSFPDLKDELFVNLIGYKEPNLVHLYRCRGQCGDREGEGRCSPIGVQQKSIKMLFRTQLTGRDPKERIKELILDEHTECGCSCSPYTQQMCARRLNQKTCKCECPDSEFGAERKKCESLTATYWDWDTCTCRNRKLETRGADYTHPGYTCQTGRSTTEILGMKITMALLGVCLVMSGVLATLAIYYRSQYRLKKSSDNKSSKIITKRSGTGNSKKHQSMSAVSRWTDDGLQYQDHRIRRPTTTTSTIPAAISKDYSRQTMFDIEPQLHQTRIYKNEATWDKDILNNFLSSISARDYNDQDEYDQHGVRIDHQYIA